MIFAVLIVVGVRRFERPTTRPPDAYSNRAELHPELEGAKLLLISELCNRRFAGVFFQHGVARSLTRSYTDGYVSLIIANNICIPLLQALKILFSRF